ISPTFASQIELVNNPFPPPYGPFTINGGAASTTDQNVALDIDLPPNAAEMTITTDPLSPGPWLAAGDSANFILPAAPGPYTIYVQSSTVSAVLSPTDTSQIELQQLSGAALRFRRGRLSAMSRVSPPTESDRSWASLSAGRSRQTPTGPTRVLGQAGKPY